MNDMSAVNLGFFQAFILFYKYYNNAPKGEKLKGPAFLIAHPQYKEQDL